MPIIIERQDVDDVLSLEEFITVLETTVDVSDAESLAEAAPQFQALANDEDLVASHLDAQIKKYFSAARSIRTGPSRIFDRRDSSGGEHGLPHRFRAHTGAGSAVVSREYARHILLIPSVYFGPVHDDLYTKIHEGRRHVASR